MTQENTVTSLYNPPKAELLEEVVQEKPARLIGISFQGRLGRLSYLNLIWVVYGLALLLAFGMGVFMAIFNRLDFHSLTSISESKVTLMSAIIVLIACFLGFRGMVLRLHDLDKSGWHSVWLLLGFVPYIGILLLFGFFIYLLCRNGTIGGNYYGSQPEKGLLTGVILTCLLVAVIFFAAVFA